MNSKITDLARYTLKLLEDLDCQAEYRKVATANEDLSKAMQVVKYSEWNVRFSVTGDDHDALVTQNQKVHECYAVLKRILLETYRDIFQQLKGL